MLKKHFFTICSSEKTIHFHAEVDDKQFMDESKNINEDVIVGYCESIDSPTDDETCWVYDDELKNYIKTTEKNYVMRKRLMYAYYLIIKKDAEKSSQEYALAQKMESTYPGRGEYLSEMELINYVKDNFS